MGVRLFVGNLPYDTTESELREAFSAVAPPTLVRVATDRETGKPRGFAFVEFTERSQAEAAIQRLNNQLFKGRPLAVNEARPREDRGGAPSPNRPYAPRPDRPYGSRPEPLSSPMPIPLSDSPEDMPRKGDAIRRSFGPDAQKGGKKKEKYRSNKEGPQAKRPRQDLPPDEEEDEVDGPDDFMLWKSMDEDESK